MAELAWCRSFLAVLEHGGFLAAAKATHRAQSRISAHVAALEDEVGARLLNRDVHPPTLTRAGEAFLPHARAAVTEWQSGLSAAAWTAGQIHGNVAVGSIPSVSSQLIAPAIGRFATEHPDVTFEVHEGPNSWLDDALAHRLVDLSVRPMFEDSAMVGVTKQELLRDPFVLIVRRDHPFAERGAVRLSDLEGESLISTGEAGFDPHVGVEYRTLLAEVAINREHSLAVTQPTTVFAFVKQGIALGLIGSLAARMMMDPELCVVTVIDDAASRRIGMYWAKTRPLSPVASAFMSVLRELAGLVEAHEGTVTHD